MQEKKLYCFNRQLTFRSSLDTDESCTWRLHDWHSSTACHGNVNFGILREDGLEEIDGKPEQASKPVLIMALEM